MKLGLPVNICERRGAGSADLLRLREQGLVELVELRLPRSLRPLPREKRDDLQRATDCLGLSTTLHSEVTTFAAHPAPTVRLQLAATLGSTIRLAQELGAGVITVHPPIALGERAGAMPGARWTEHERRLLSEAERGGSARELFADLLRNVTGLARETGVAIAIENMRPRDEGADLNGVQSLCRFVRGLDLPHVRVCLDLRKAFGEGLDLAKLIVDERDLLADVHVAGVGRRGTPAGLGARDIDWASAVRALAENSYAGPLVYEGPMRDAEASLSALRCVVTEALRVT